MSDCIEGLSIGSRVGKQMQELLNAGVERLGVNRAELVRRLFNYYRESHRVQMDCLHCGDTIALSLKS